MCEQIKEFASANNDKIIMGFGASAHSVEEKRLISKNELDKACHDRAIFIVKYDGHSCILTLLRIVLGVITVTALSMRACQLMSGDAPCTLPDPIFGIYAACNHYIPEQSVTIQEALKMYTYNAAWTTFDEKDRGSLGNGKIADMVILNKNPLAIKPSELLNLKVEKLLLSGTVYKKGQGILSLLAKGILSEGKI